MVIDNEQVAQAMVWMIALPAGVALINGLLGARLPKATSAFLACGAMLASFGCALSAFWALQQAPSGSAFVTPSWPWLHSTFVHVDLTLRLDALSATLALIICGIGSLIHIFSYGYMAHEGGIGRYFSYLNLFCSAMLLLVLGDSLPSLFIGWEGVGLCSYLLIGFAFTDVAKAAAGRKAFVVNRVGDVGLLLAMFLLHSCTGTLQFDKLTQLAQNHALPDGVAFWACTLMVLGVAGKSAQLPLYIWLPDAMAGPTPVSALIHAATMVTAGIYLMARTQALFLLVPDVQMWVAILGASTALFAATVACVQQDIKKVLAYSTVSQLGYMVLAAGLGAPALALFHVVTHAFFKACLFLGAGAVIHALADEQDIRRMGGLCRIMPLTCATFTLSTLALCGLPPLSGFVSKDAILAQAFATSYWGGGLLGYALFAVGLVTAALTAGYMGRLLGLTFFSGRFRGPQKVRQNAHDPSWSMALPLVVLALLSVIGGALNWPHVLGGHTALSAWLTPQLTVQPAWPELPFGVEWLLMAASTAAALLGLGGAALLFWRRAPKAPAGRPGAWRTAMTSAWGVDAGLQSMFAAPYVKLGRGLKEGVERPVIEGGLTFVAWLVRSLGAGLQMFHSGNIQRYLAAFALGLGLLLYGWLLPAKVLTPSPALAPHGALQQGARP
jgi:NADH-quinone oxidoreductase subunit L